MSRSIQEEIIGILWLIACLLFLQNDLIWGVWLAGIKCISDQLCAIKFAWKEATEERAKEQKGAKP